MVKLLCTECLYQAEHTSVCCYSSIVLWGAWRTGFWQAGHKKGTSAGHKADEVTVAMEMCSVLMPAGSRDLGSCAQAFSVSSPDFLLYEAEGSKTGLSIHGGSGRGPCPSPGVTRLSFSPSSSSGTGTARGGAAASDGT